MWEFDFNHYKVKITKIFNVNIIEIESKNMIPLFYFNGKW